jgi:meso-butanediol dehydrogenase / (S,S)-butanediol dehydrogenase / diacetyl reductase
MTRTIVITGAGAGLGRALARELTRRGEQTVLLGRTLEKLHSLVAELGQTSMAVECDVGNPESVRSAFAAIEKRHAHIDVLINNAAIYEPVLVREATDLQIHNALQTNLAGPIYCSRAALPLMQRGAQIINISTDTVVTPYAMFSLYQSTKAGLERFTAALRAEVEPAGIRVSLMRAGPMYDRESAWRVAPDVVKRFAEENIKRGIDSKKMPVSSFASAAKVITTLLDLPADVDIAAMHAEGHRP